jgi:hypothetical protein
MGLTKPYWVFRICDDGIIVTSNCNRGRMRLGAIELIAENTADRQRLCGLLRLASDDMWNRNWVYVGCSPDPKES